VDSQAKDSDYSDDDSGGVSGLPATYEVTSQALPNNPLLNIPISNSADKPCAFLCSYSLEKYFYLIVVFKLLL
jgi:hypothetical protein